MNNIVNQIPFLPTSRNFPPEIRQLTIEIDKSYIDIANSVNNRIIGIFPANNPAINGESWFLKNQRQQGFRKIFTISDFSTFVTGIQIIDVNFFTKIYGVCLSSGGNYFPIPYIDGNSTTSNIGLFVGPGIEPGIFSVTFSVGATAPTLVSGIIILEWISQI